MPPEGQASVSIPKWVLELAKEYFKKHEKELRLKGVRSTNGLITYWAREALRDDPE